MLLYHGRCEGPFRRVLHTRQVLIIASRPFGLDQSVELAVFSTSPRVIPGVPSRRRRPLGHQVRQEQSTPSPSPGVLLFLPAVPGPRSRAPPARRPPPPPCQEERGPWTTPAVSETPAATPGTT
ncbi:hypothetical protein MTO96_005604 [Rhipicephalus appendiculatus]